MIFAAVEPGLQPWLLGVSRFQDFGFRVQGLGGFRV